MGGSALAKFGVERIDTPELELELKNILKMLQFNCPGVLFEPIRWYSTKPNHGDIDILYTLKDSNVNVSDVLKNVLEGYNPIGHFSDPNSLCFSFVWKCKSGAKVQTDLIYTPVESYDFAHCYYSYNDLGNLLGVLFKAGGIKLGHQGLIYTLTVDTRHIADIVISLDWEAALNVLGYSNYHTTKFSSLEDIFKFVSDNKYFSPHYYSLPNRCHASRIRDKKRKTYMEFLSWLDARTFKKGKALEPDVILKRCFRLFPDFKLRYDAVIQRDKENMVYKSKFSGDVVSKVTGLTTKELGRFMEALRKSFGDKLRTFVLSANKAEIEKMIREFHSTYKSY